MNRKEFLEKWCQELETTTLKKCTGIYGYPTGPICAMGLADLVVLHGDAVGEGLITSDEWSLVVHWNDTEQLTFPQIAEKVRQEFINSPVTTGIQVNPTIVGEKDKENE